MNNLFNVFNFENKIKFKQKSFIIFLISIFTLSFLGGIAPSIFEKINFGKNNVVNDISSSEKKEKSGSLILFLNGKVNPELIDLLNKKYDITEVKSEDEIKKLIEQDNEKKFGLVLKSSTEAKVYSVDSFLNHFDSEVENILDKNLKYNVIAPNLNLTSANVNAIENSSENLNISFERIGNNFFAGYIVAYAGIMIIYFMLIFFGSNIAMSICREKETRIIELLVTNTKLKNLILGKVLSATFLSLLQIFTILIGFLSGIFLGKLIGGNLASVFVNIILNIKISTIFVFILFMVLGTLLYYFLFAALSSTVSKMEETNSAISPVMFLIIAIFFISISNLTMPDSSLMRFASIFPLTSPMAMFAKYALTGVSIFDLILSFVLLSISVVLVGMLSVKIYRVFSLNYGNKMNIFKVLIKIFKKE